MAAITICSDFGAPKNKVWPCFPIYFPWSDGTRCHDHCFLCGGSNWFYSSVIFYTVKRGEWKSWLKLNIQKTKIMASCLITSWEIDGERVETVSDFIFWGSEITADGDCSHESKRHLLLGRKVMSNLDSILKSRDITLSTKVRLVKAMVLPVVMYGCESWTVKKAEGRRIDAFELWCWRRLLRVPWTARNTSWNQDCREKYQ